MQTVEAKAEAERPKEKARSIAKLPKAKLPKAKPEVNQKAKHHSNPTLRLKRCLRRTELRLPA